MASVSASRPVGATAVFHCDDGVIKEFRHTSKRERIGNPVVNAESVGRRAFEETQAAGNPGVASVTSPLEWQG